MTTTGLAGRRIVVTRAERQAGSLIGAIEDRGGLVVALPLLEITDAADGGAALRRALDGLDSADWLVVLSPNGARRIVGHIEPGRCNLAVIGDGTGSVFVSEGWDVDLIPEVASSEGLLEAFGPVKVEGEFLIAQAEAGRTLLADGLRERGETVEVVSAYGNHLPTIDPENIARAHGADMVVFASPSAVERYVALVGATPSKAVCIGSVTAGRAVAEGFDVTTASQPTVPALLDALEGA